MKWFAEQPENANGWWVVCDEQGRELGSADGGFCEDQARLIAAAPDLLEALENLLAVSCGDGGTKPNAHELARLAMNKALGIEQRNDKKE